LVTSAWIWELGNRVLYDLCKSHPAYRSDEEIVAKIWLIGVKSILGGVASKRIKSPGMIWAASRKRRGALYGDFYLYDEPGGAILSNQRGRGALGLTH
jgi:hypothetical protein